MGTTTPNYGLYKPAIDEQDWGEDVNTSTDAVDTQMKVNEDAAATNATDIGTNATDIGTNTTDIGTNTTDIGTNTTAIGLNTTHRTLNDGSDHSFIDQSVVSGATPTLVGTNFTGIPVSGIATGTDGELITWDAAGDPATVAVGTATHVLTSNGPGAAPTFQAAAAGTDRYVGIDAAANPGYLGAAAGDGVLRTSTPFSYTDGGDFVTLTLDTTADVDSTGTWQFARVELDAATEYIDASGGSLTFTDTNSGTVDLAALTTSSISFIIDGGGAAITTGIKGDIEVPFACSITQVTMLLDQSSTTTVDIWKDTYANFPPTDADSITAAAVPGTTASNKDQDSTLTGWTTTVAAGDIIRFNVDANDNAERCTISLKVVKT